MSKYFFVKKTVFNELKFICVYINRENVEKLSNVIKLVDSDQENNLDLFCYLNCKKSDPEFLQKCRGLVFNEKNLVLKGFPYTQEYTEDDNKDFDFDISTCLFYKSYEGCLIRIFYFNNKWYTSTNKKLNAFRSKWASKKSYGTFFNEALEYQFKNNEKSVE
jgi:hypothetical protein